MSNGTGIERKIIWFSWVSFKP